MKAIAMVAATVLAALAAFAAEPESVDVAPAMRAADEWLALVDRGAYGESWDRAGVLAHEQQPRVKWELQLEAVRGKLGGVMRRKLRSATYVKDPPNAPPGEYVVVQYDTVFENRPLTVETVSPVRQKDGSWKVSGYFVR